MAHEIIRRPDGVTEVRIDPALERPDAEIAALGGKFITRECVDLLIGDPGKCPADWPAEKYVEAPAVVRLASGEMLLAYVHQALGNVCADAYESLRRIDLSGTNRGTASGVKASFQEIEDRGPSRTNAVPPASRLRGAGSSVTGSMERSPRFPACRLTAFNLDHPERFAKALPFIQEVDAVFARELPERHAAQMAYLKRTHPAWTISGTSFTTVTVNKSFRTAVHKDRGDLKAGFGVMCALRAGEFTGCWTVFPAFGVAIDMRTRGVLLADVHQWHANTLLVGDPGHFERIACVFYYRERMEKCLDPQGERDRAAERQEGDPIWDPEELG